MRKLLSFLALVLAPLAVMPGASTINSYRQASAPVATPFVTAQSVGGPRNDLAGKVGYVVTIGASPITVTAVGRWTSTSNSLTHVVGIYTTGGSLVTGGSATVDMSGATISTYQYANLAAPIVLSAGTTYYIVSDETYGGDYWQEHVNGGLTPTAAGTIPGDCYNDGTFHAGVTANTGFGPVNFKYY